jgi:hypothetical protein
LIGAAVSALSAYDGPVGDPLLLAIIDGNYAWV